MKDVIVSGIKPTGTMHLGNYLGALRQWVKLQADFDCYFFIADLHALTEVPEPKTLHGLTLELGRTLLALGLDPKRVTLFAQSHVVGHTELAWVFNCLTSVGELERMTQYKDRATVRGEKVNVGLLDYPVLQAADILLYKGTRVPVGEDQVQHLELTREVARAFNRAYGETFPETKPYLTRSARVMSLKDPEKKMSKTGDETVMLTDEPDVIRKKIRGAVTATTGGVKSAGAENLLLLLEAFMDEATAKPFRAAEANGTIRYADLKRALADVVVEHFADFRERYAALTDAVVLRVLADGALRAQGMADRVLGEVRKKVGLLALR